MSVDRKRSFALVARCHDRRSAVSLRLPQEPGVTDLEHRAPEFCHSQIGPATEVSNAKAETHPDSAGSKFGKSHRVDAPLLRLLRGGHDECINDRTGQDKGNKGKAKPKHRRCGFPRVDAGVFQTLSEEDAQSGVENWMLIEGRLRPMTKNRLEPRPMQANARDIIKGAKAAEGNRAWVRRASKFRSTTD
jgi:hypothetical protein